MTEDRGATNAQRLLHRLLRTALLDDAAVADTLTRARSKAGISELPRASGALLTFVRVHVLPLIRARLTPQLVSALLEDLEAEAEFEQTKHDPTSSSRLAIATRMPAAPVEELVEMMSIPSYRPPSMGDLPVADLAPAPASGAITKVVQEPTPVPPAPRVRGEDERATVLLIDPDRLGRAAMARALINAGFDVAVLDDPHEILEAIVARPTIDLLLTEIDGIEVDPILRAFVAHRPGIPVLVWTKAARATADHVLRVSDVATFEIFGKASRIGDVVEGARKLARV